MEASTKYDPRDGFQINPHAKPGDFDAKAPYIDHGTALVDARRYYDSAEMRLEWERMWTKVWTLAGLACDIPEVGDYLKYDLGPASFIVVRTSADEVRAFHNVCHHRGNRLVTADFGTIGDCFHCSFHGWEYGLDGRLLKIRDQEIFRPEVIDDRPSLTPVRTALSNGLIFVTMNADAPPLEAFLDVLPAQLTMYPIGDFRVLRDLQVEWKANWKTAIDGFLEFYHGEDVHPEGNAMAESRRIQYDLYGNGHGRMLIPIGLPNKYKSGDTVPEPVQNILRMYGADPAAYPGVGTAEGFKAAYTDVKRKWAARNGVAFFEKLTDDQVTDDWNYSIFPNITINIFSDAILLQRFRPHPTDPEISFYDAFTLALPVPDPEFKPVELNSFGTKQDRGPKGWDGKTRPAREYIDDFEEMGTVLAQDAYLVPEVQKGLRSPAFKGLRLGEGEIRIRHYLAEIDRYLRGGGDS